MADTEYKIKVLLEAQNKLSGELDKVQKQITSLSKKSVKEVETLSGSFDKLKTVLGSAAVVGFASLGQSIIATAGKFEKFQSVLTNTLGSMGEAKQAMTLLKDISTKTPFELDKLTESYIKLVNRGFKPTREQITSLGDLASSQGKQFDMLVEALLDAQTGEMERLKEFGVTAQQSGNKVAFTFKGVTTTVAKTDEAIRNYVLGLGNLEGIQGSMITQSDTYEGKISNLKDARTNLSATIGTQFLPTAKKSISTLTDMLNKLNDNVKVISDWGMSTDSNVVLVAKSFELLKQSSTGLPSIGTMFQTGMANVQKSIFATMPLIGGMIIGLEKLFGLAKQASGASQIATRNALVQSSAMGVAPSVITDRIKNQLESGQLALAKITAAGGGRSTAGLGGSSKEKTNEKQIAQEKELIKLTNDRVNEVNKLNISETKKAQLIIGINEDMQKQLKKIRGDDQEDQFSYFEELSKTAQDRLEKVKDSFKGIYEAVKDAMSKSKDEVSKLDDKIKDGLDKIKDLKQSLVDSTKDTQTGLTDRFVEITNQMAEMQKQGFNFGSLEEYNKQQEKYAALQKELGVITSNVNNDSLTGAVAFSQLSPAEQLLEKSKVKEGEIRLEIKAQEDKVKLLQKQREDELTTMQNFNIAKDQIEKDYTKMFKDQLQERTIAYGKFISDIEAMASASKSGVSNLVNGAMSGGNGSELFVPSASGGNTPNGQTVNNTPINISVNGLSVRSESDIQSIADALYRKIELNRNYQVA